MAKEKKAKKAIKQEPAQDEPLAQALVPEDEQPYKVPDNWVWVRLGSSINLISGRDISISLCNDEGKGIPYILGASNLENDIFNIERWIESPDVVSVEGDILLSVKGTIGKVYLQKESKINISRQIMALRALPLIYNAFLKYFVTNICEELKEAGNGLIPGISRDIILKTKFSLPPLPEQHRIVERIENLFEKLDRAKELVQSALDSFETRKAAMLHKAFTGELTAKWREENGVGLDSWESTTIGEVSKISSGGTPSRTNPQFYEGNIPWVKTGEIIWNVITDTEEHITEDAIVNSSAKIFPQGTVLVAMYGQGFTRGRAAVLGIKASTNQAVCALIPSVKLLNQYLYYYFECNYWKFREKAVGGNQPNYSGTMIAKFPIHLPSLLEQQEIACILDNLFEKEQRARELCDIVEKIDLMKKAILARAFRGELGTNNPPEESTMGLLTLPNKFGIS